MLNISAARRNNRSIAELNMAPMIDMVFLLLIFFLVTTSFVKETGIEVSRPTATTAEQKEKSTLLVGINADNRIYFDRREIDIRAVRANIERGLAENPEGSVVIVADKASATGVAIEVMDGCRLAGAKNVSIAAKLPQGE